VEQDAAIQHQKLEIINTYRTVVRRYIGKGPLGSQNMRCGENITIGLRIRKLK
jgi:hypothetical protein